MNFKIQYPTYRKVSNKIKKNGIQCQRPTGGRRVSVFGRGVGR
jgi:hypothetical protein